LRVPIIGQRGLATPLSLWMVMSSLRAGDDLLRKVTNSRTLVRASRSRVSDLMDSSS